MHALASHGLKGLACNPIYLQLSGCNLVVKWAEYEAIGPLYSSAHTVLVEAQGLSSSVTSFPARLYQECASLSIE